MGTIWVWLFRLSLSEKGTKEMSSRRRWSLCQRADKKMNNSNRKADQAFLSL